MKRADPIAVSTAMLVCSWRAAADFAAIAAVRRETVERGDCQQNAQQHQLQQCDAVNNRLSIPRDSGTPPRSPFMSSRPSSQLNCCRIARAHKFILWRLDRYSGVSAIRLTSAEGDWMASPFCARRNLRRLKKKRGLAIISEKTKAGDRRYRIAE